MNLFGPPNAYGGFARTTDPGTSHAAAAEHQASGRMGTNEAIALALVRRLPGSTYRELWATATDEERATLGSHIELMRRLGGAKAKGRIRHGAEKLCTVGGRMMVTWEVA